MVARTRLEVKMEDVLKLTFSSSLTDICELNSSFDKGILKIAYCGDNRNKTSISEEVFEKCKNTAYNCPIVCNYDRATDEIGGHDIELVSDSDGELHIINVTTPVGCVPESANIWFDDVEEEDGQVHRYLFADALLWKRQEAYEKIKREGISAQSMEITVKDAEMVNGILHIKDFEFTAFTIIGVEPCFESASIEVFSKKNFNYQMSEMMQELKESFKSISNSFKRDDDIHPHNDLTEGGNDALSTKLELAKKYGIDLNSLDFSIDDLSIEELEAKFVEVKKSQDKSFMLNSNFSGEVNNRLKEVTVQKYWGEERRYFLADYDHEAKEIYCWDTEDWLLYGFTFTMDGDKVVIDFDSKKRKKYTVVDFVDGEDQTQVSPFVDVYSRMEAKIKESSEWETKYEKASKELTEVTSKMEELQNFKLETERGKAEEAAKAVFDQFKELDGNETFEELKKNYTNYSAEELEDRCYSIRGRLASVQQLTFSAKQTSPKILVNSSKDDTSEPYGGIVRDYGVAQNN